MALFFWPATRISTQISYLKAYLESRLIYDLTYLQSKKSITSSYLIKV